MVAELSVLPALKLYLKLKKLTTILKLRAMFRCLFILIYEGKYKIR